MLPRFAGTAESGWYLDPEVERFIVAEYQAGRSLRDRGARRIRD